MNVLEISGDSDAHIADAGFTSTVLLEHDQMKVRRITLASGAQIPPCQMHDDLVFFVISGLVTFRSEGEETLVASPGAVFIPGGTTTRSMEAHEASHVVAVLCRRAATATDGGLSQL